MRFFILAVATLGLLSCEEASVKPSPKEISSQKLQELAQAERDFKFIGFEDKHSTNFSGRREREALTNANLPIIVGHYLEEPFGHSIGSRFFSYTSYLENKYNGSPTSRQLEAEAEDLLAETNGRIMLLEHTFDLQDVLRRWRTGNEFERREQKEEIVSTIAEKIEHDFNTSKSSSPVLLLSDSIEVEYDFEHEEFEVVRYIHDYFTPAGSGYRKSSEQSLRISDQVHRAVLTHQLIGKPIPVPADNAEAFAEYYRTFVPKTPRDRFALEAIVAFELQSMEPWQLGSPARTSWTAACFTLVPGIDYSASEDSFSAEVRSIGEGRTDYCELAANLNELDPNR